MDITPPDGDLDACSFDLRAFLLAHPPDELPDVTARKRFLLTVIEAHRLSSQTWTRLQESRDTLESGRALRSARSRYSSAGESAQTVQVYRGHSGRGRLRLVRPR